MSDIIIRKGSLWDVKMPQVIGKTNIQQGRRPCYIWSNNQNNKYCNTLNIIPLTSRINKVYPMHVLIPTKYGLKVPSYTLPEQITTVPKSSLLGYIGQCDDLMIKKVERGVNIQRGDKNICDSLNKQVYFDENRLLEQVRGIQKKELIMKHQSNPNAANFLKNDIDIQISFLRHYCEDFGKNFQDYFIINNYKENKKKELAYV